MCVCVCLPAASYLCATVGLKSTCQMSDPKQMLVILCPGMAAHGEFWSVSHRGSLGSLVYTQMDTSCVISHKNRTANHLKDTL